MGIKVLEYKVVASTAGKIRLEVLLSDSQVVVFDESKDAELRLMHIVKLLESNWDIYFERSHENPEDLKSAIFSTQNRKSPTIGEAMSFELTRLKSKLPEGFIGTGPKALV